MFKLKRFVLLLVVIVVLVARVGVAAVASALKEMFILTTSLVADWARQFSYPIIRSIR